MTSTDKPSRSAAELHGERDCHSVIASQHDWASNNETTAAVATCTGCERLKPFNSSWLTNRTGML